MATNFYFDKYDNQSEQELMADLIEEAIKIYGDDMVYVVRTIQNYDPLYAADDQSLYQDTYECEMYINNNRGFGGNRDFFNAFGAQIQEELTLTVSMRAFEENVSSRIGTYIDVTTKEPVPFTRPREGDLVFFPRNKKCFMITFVENKEQFYPLGTLFTWEITAELFKYSGEKFNTGISDIDDIYKLSTNIVDRAIKTDNGNLLTTDDGDLIIDAFKIDTIDPNAQNDYFQEQFDEFVDFSEIDPFSENKQ